MDSQKTEKPTKNKALNMLSVFSKHQLILGLPSHVFGMGAALSCITFFLLSKIMGLIFAALYFRVMYAIHETDPKGFDVWRRALNRRSNGWSAGEVQTTRLILIKD